jgi:beta-glucosidase
VDGVATNPHKVVLLLLNAGSVELAWPKASTAVGAILHSSFPGQAAGKAAAAVIAGDAGPPAGRLALTYYDGLGVSLPSISNYSMANRTYRYLTPEVPVTYNFGFGLSGWGSGGGFSYSNVSISPSGPVKISRDMEVVVTFDITNRGLVSSDEVVQLYLRSSSSGGGAGAQTPHTPRPELKGFRRVHALRPNERRSVALSLGWRELSALRRGDLRRVVEASSRVVFVGGGQPHEFSGGVSASFSTVL